MIEDAEVAEIVRAIEEGLNQWLDEEANRSFHEHMCWWAEKINERPVEERLRVLAALYDSEYEPIAASVADVTFAYEPKAVTLNLSIRFTRSIEAVYVEARVG
jgi:hypothetical protein